MITKKKLGYFFFFKCNVCPRSQVMINKYVAQDGDHAKPSGGLTPLQ